MNEYYKVEDVCKVKGGKRIPQGCTLQETPNNHPYIRILDMYQGRIINISEEMQYAKDEYWNVIKSYIVKKGDVILAIVGNTLGMVSIIGDTLDNANLTENCCKFDDLDTDKVRKLFLYYSLIAPLNQKNIEKFKVGSSQPKLPIYNINQLLIPRWDVKVQDKITGILSAIDSKIEINIQIVKELESMAKTIFDYWFLQYEFPNEDGKPYKSSGGKMVWNEELEREIPEGWKIGNLNSFIKKDKGGDWGKETQEGKYTKKVTCLRGADFPAIYGTSKLEAPERFIHEKNIYKLLAEGDLIIEISGGSPIQSTGRICYINKNVLRRFKNDLITSNFCKAISLVDKEFMYWFYVLWCNLYDSGVFFQYEGKTTGIKNLLFEMLCRDYPMVIPDSDMIKRYNNKMEVLFEKIQANLLENAGLSAMKDFLLPLLMNGQVGFM